MTKFGKIILGVGLALIVLAGVLGFMLPKVFSPEPVEDSGNHVTVPQPSGNVAVGSDVIDPGDSTPTDIHLPASPEDTLPGDISGGENDGEQESPMVNEDGIPTVEAIKKAQETDVNLYGRLVIPLAGINVRLYQTQESKVVAADDSAIMFQLNGALVIADMWKQGFSNLQMLTKGSEMYLVTNAGVSHYLCSRSEQGRMVNGNLEYPDTSHVTDAPVGAVTVYGQMNATGDVWLTEFTDTGETTSIGAGDGEVDVGPVVPGLEPPTTGGQSSSGGASQSPNSNPQADPDDWTSGAGYIY